MGTGSQCLPIAREPENLTIPDTAVGRGGYHAQSASTPFNRSCAYSRAIGGTCPHPPWRPVSGSVDRTRHACLADCRDRSVGDGAPKVRFAPDSALEEDGFELPVPRRKSRGFPQHSGHCGGIGEALKRYHLMVQPFFFCASNHSIESGWGTF